MGKVTKPYEFSASATIVAPEFNSNYDTIYNEFNGNIDTDNIDASAAITDAKLAQVATASKVSATAITAWASIPSGGGNLPAANTPDKVVLSATDAVTELTIASGAITVTQSYHSVDTESDDASDLLATINGGVEGMILVLRAAHDDRTVTLDDFADNINCTGDRDLDNTADTITLFYDGSMWQEIAFSDNTP